MRGSQRGVNVARSNSLREASPPPYRRHQYLPNPGGPPLIEEDYPSPGRPVSQHGPPQYYQGHSPHHPHDPRKARRSEGYDGYNHDPRNDGRDYYDGPRHNYNSMERPGNDHSNSPHKYGHPGQDMYRHPSRSSPAINNQMYSPHRAEDDQYGNQRKMANGQINNHGNSQGARRQLIPGPGSPPGHQGGGYHGHPSSPAEQYRTVSCLLFVISDFMCDKARFVFQGFPKRNHEICELGRKSAILIKNKLICGIHVYWFFSCCIFLSFFAFCFMIYCTMYRRNEVFRVSVVRVTYPLSILLLRLTKKIHG